MMTNQEKRGIRWGTAALEAAVVMPIFLLLFFGILEYARFVFTVDLLNNAAREGARYAVVETFGTLTTAQVQTYVDQYLAGQGSNQIQGYSPTTSISVFQADPVTGLDNGLGWQNAGRGQPIGVQISGNFTPVLGNFIFMGKTISIQAKCIMYSEAN